MNITLYFDKFFDLKEENYFRNDTITIMTLNFLKAEPDETIYSLRTKKIPMARGGVRPLVGGLLVAHLAEYGDRSFLVRDRMALNKQDVIAHNKQDGP